MSFGLCKTCPLRVTATTFIILAVSKLKLYETFKYEDYNLCIWKQWILQISFYFSDTTLKLLPFFPKQQKCHLAAWLFASILLSTIFKLGDLAILQSKTLRGRVTWTLYIREGGSTSDNFGSGFVASISKTHNVREKLPLWRYTLKHALQTLWGHLIILSWSGRCVHSDDTHQYMSCKHCGNIFSSFSGQLLSGCSCCLFL